jgi:protein SCO1/2
MKNKILAVLLFSVMNLNLASAQTSQKIQIGIDEKLGSYIPLDTKFVTSDNDTLTMAELITKPTLISLVYYQCPGICSPLLTELGWVANKIDLKPVKDFQVVSLSFDHHETPEIAKKWKENYLKGIKGNFPADGWIFLTGDSINIKKFTDAVGFYFKPDKKEFVHAGTVLTLSPKGKIARYIYGTEFNPFEMKMALLEAEAGKSSPTSAKVLQFCFSYDPKGRSYTLNITRIIGSFMLLTVGTFLFFLIKKKKK